MKLIKKLSEMIEDELEGAEAYAKCAIKHQDDDKELARAFQQMSYDEMKHVDLLHGQVVRIIEAYRREKSDPPEAMMAVYEFLHERQIKKAGEVKNLQSMFT